MDRVYVEIVARRGARLRRHRVRSRQGGRRQPGDRRQVEYPRIRGSRSREASSHIAFIARQRGCGVGATRDAPAGGVVAAAPGPAGVARPKPSARH